MRAELVFATIALVLSLVSITTTLVFTLRQIRTTSILASNAAILEVEKLLGDVPSALKFHGIQEDDLRQADITPREFAYLLTSLTGGAIYHRTVRKTNDDPFEEGSYRYIMCSQPSTQRAWPLIRRMMGEHIFRTKMDKTINLMTRSKTVNNIAS